MIRHVRSYRFFLIACFLIAIFSLIYRIHSITDGKAKSSNILLNRINDRLFILKRRYPHVNMSILLKAASHKRLSVIYRCEESCGGWGDRLRGITSAYMLAVLSQRQFYIDMLYPCSLENFLKPHLYDWRLIKYKTKRSQLIIDTTREGDTSDKIYEQISSSNFISDWYEYDDIIIKTNSDYITPALANKYVENQVKLLNIPIDESRQTRLFPLLYEILFQPTERVTRLVNQLLMKTKENSSKDKELVCLHIRIGRNPAMTNDKILSYRDTIVPDMLKFVKNNLTNKNSLIFVTSDSVHVNNYISTNFDNSQSISIPGPIVHIDRLPTFYSTLEQCEGFLKVIADFYVLGECDTLVMARSGFSEWASRRRYLIDQFHELYLYCRGIYKITGFGWKRPYKTC